MPIIQNGEENLFQELIESIQNFIEFCQISVKPIKVCGGRSNCCGFSMISLFHESKQMGIVLRKSFKGRHFWIPPIKKQIQDAINSGFETEKIISL